MIQHETKILGGLNVTVSLSIARAEPDVGIFSDYVEDWHITHVCGKRKHRSFIDALERQVRAKEKDFAVRLMEEYNEQA